MKKEIIIILSVIILSACASATKTQSPDGGTRHEIDCSGIGLTWSECGVKARRVCQGNYTQISSSREGGKKTSRSMIIECDSKI